MAENVSERVGQLGQAPLEGGFEFNAGYDMCITLVLETTNEEYSISSGFLDLIKDYSEGMGRVDLVRATLQHTFLKKDQILKWAVVNVNNTKGVNFMCKTPNGSFVTCTDLTYGQCVTTEIVVPQLFSRQIQPTSSNLPACKLLLAASKGLSCSLNLYLKIHGPIMRYGSLNC